MALLKRKEKYDFANGAEHALTVKGLSFEGKEQDFRLATFISIGRSGNGIRANAYSIEFKARKNKREACWIDDQRYFGSNGTGLKYEKILAMLKKLENKINSFITIVLPNTEYLTDELMDLAQSIVVRQNVVHIAIYAQDNPSIDTQRYLRKGFNVLLVNGVEHGDIRDKKSVLYSITGQAIETTLIGFCYRDKEKVNSEGVDGLRTP